MRRWESIRRGRRVYQQGAGNDKGMEGYWEEASEMGDAQVSRRPRGDETTRERYAGTDTRNAQVVGCYCAEERRTALAERERGRLSLGGESDGGRGRLG